MIDKILVPKDRIGVVLGRNGETKKKIETLGVQLRIQDVEVTMESEDGLAILVAKTIITAIARGFSPERAFLLTDEENLLNVMTLPGNEKKLKRLRARLIGSSGKARANLERLTNTNISIYGKTVSVIGKPDDVEKCIKAVEKIISGSEHKFVYTSLERQAMIKQNLKNQHLEK